MSETSHFPVKVFHNVWSHSQIYVFRVSRCDGHKKQKNSCCFLLLLLLFKENHKGSLQTSPFFIFFLLSENIQHVQKQNSSSVQKVRSWFLLVRPLPPTSCFPTSWERLSSLFQKDFQRWSLKLSSKIRLRVYSATILIIVLIRACFCQHTGITEMRSLPNVNTWPIFSFCLLVN